MLARRRYISFYFYNWLQCRSWSNIEVTDWGMRGTKTWLGLSLRTKLESASFRQAVSENAHDVEKLLGATLKWTIARQLGNVVNIYLRNKYLQ